MTRPLCTLSGRITTPQNDSRPQTNVYSRLKDNTRVSWSRGEELYSAHENAGREDTIHEGRDTMSTAEDMVEQCRPPWQSQSNYLGETPISPLDRQATRSTPSHQNSDHNQPASRTHHVVLSRKTQKVTSVHQN